MNINIKKFVLSALFVALAYVLSFVKVFRMPLGGSVTLMSMFVISLPAYCFGVKYGFTSSFIYAILQLMQGGTIVHPMQVFLDYIFAFTCFGIVAFYRNIKNGSYIGFFIACTIRCISSSLSGYFFFREYTPANWNTMLYALAYNGAYIYAEYFITVGLVTVPYVKNLIRKIKFEIGNE